MEIRRLEWPSQVGKQFEALAGRPQGVGGGRNINKFYNENKQKGRKETKLKQRCIERQPMGTNQIAFFHIHACLF